MVRRTTVLQTIVRCLEIVFSIPILDFKCVYACECVTIVFMIFAIRALLVRPTVVGRDRDLMS